MRLPFILFACLLVSGCSAPPETPPSDTAAPEAPATDTVPLSGHVANTGAYACGPGGGPFVGNEHEWTIITLHRPPGATRAEVVLEWDPINPTMESLEVGLRPAGTDDFRPEVVLGPGTSPWTLRIGEDVLDRFGARFILSVDAGRACETEPGVGVHAASATLDDRQAFTGVLTWH